MYFVASALLNAHLFKKASVVSDGVRFTCQSIDSIEKNLSHLAPTEYKLPTQAKRRYTADALLAGERNQFLHKSKGSEWLILHRV